MDVVKELRKAVEKAKGIKAGTVVRFRVRFEGSDRNSANGYRAINYRYVAAALGNGQWIVSGVRNNGISGFKSEAAFLALLGNTHGGLFVVSEAEVATEWEAL